MDKDKEAMEKSMHEIKDTARGLLKDLVEVAIIFIVIISILRIALGPPIPPIIAPLLIPIVAVESESMEHHSDAWLDWLKSHHIPESQIEQFHFQGGFDKGDFIVTKWSEVKMGDVMIYKRDLAHSSGNEPPSYIELLES